MPRRPLRARRGGLLAALLLLALALPALPVAAQDARILGVDDWTYVYLQRLQRRGLLLELNPTALPYRRGDVADALRKLDDDNLTPVEARWVQLLRDEFAPSLADAGEDAVVGLEVGGGVRAADSRRLDPLRPVGDDLEAQPYARGRFYLEGRGFVGELGLRMDRYYNNDVDGIDLARRLNMRNVDTYVGYRHRWASLYAGRFNHHWSLHGEAAGLISMNPPPYDVISLRLGGERLALRSLVGELDSANPDGTFTGRGATKPGGGIRRYVSAHRIDWRPTPHLTLSFMESILFSGPNAGLTLKQLNPLLTYLFEIDNQPKNDENNGFIAGLLWAQLGRVTLYSQFMLDDLDRLKLFDEDAEPTSLTWISAVQVGRLTPTVDVGASLDVVASRTYNTNQPEGKYLFLRRGLATQFSDYVHATAYADVYLDELVPGLMVTPRVHVLAQGEQDIRAPFPGRDGPGFILSGDEATTWRGAVQVRLQPTTWWWVRADLGVNRTTQPGFDPAAETETRFSGLVEAGVRLSLSRGYALSF